MTQTYILDISGACMSCSVYVSMLQTQTYEVIFIATHGVYNALLVVWTLEGLFRLLLCWIICVTAICCYRIYVSSHVSLIRVHSFYVAFDTFFVLFVINDPIHFF
jgi:hypothetical protein